jgi:lysozyme
MDDTLADCQKLPYWEELNDARRLVIADMVFNMGYRRFLSFVKTNAALEAGDYSEAAAEMMDSKWYRQTGRRARKLCSIMLWGDLDVSE